MIGCVIAMNSEAEILLEQMEIENIQTIFGKTVHFGKAFGKELFVVVSGEGKVNASIGVCAAIAKGADILLNFGVAGGLRPERTEVSQLYVIERAVQYDFDLVQLTGQPIGTLPGETENFLHLHCPAALKFPRRALGTGDRFDDSPVDHALLLKLGCDIREMEAGAMAQAAKSAGIPFVSVKGISDVYGSGSTTDQFRKNLKIALLNLKSHLKEIITAIE